MPVAKKKKTTTTSKKRKASTRKRKAVLPEEPEYVFIKDKGWVPAIKPGETAWFVTGNRKFIFVERQPELGENYFSEDKVHYDPVRNRLPPLQRVVRDLQEDEYWTERLVNAPISELKADLIPVWQTHSERWEKGRKVYAVEVVEM